jgi:hypothetical protein
MKFVPARLVVLENVVVLEKVLVPLTVMPSKKFTAI